MAEPFFSVYAPLPQKVVLPTSLQCCSARTTCAGYQCENTIACYSRCCLLRHERDPMGYDQTSVLAPRVVQSAPRGQALSPYLACSLTSPVSARFNARFCQSSTLLFLASEYLWATDSSERATTREHIPNGSTKPFIWRYVNLVHLAASQRFVPRERINPCFVRRASAISGIPSALNTLLAR